MTMKQDKVYHCSREQAEDFSSGSIPFDREILNRAVDSYSVVRRQGSRLFLSGRKKTSNGEFHLMLSEANRELASLLKDVDIGADVLLSSGPQSRPLSELLKRAVRCAAQQYVLQAAMGNLALTDELTGLYNRRGFMVLAERQLKVSRRSGRGLLLFFMDLDGLKKINDSFGHSEGDRALKHSAQALEKTFRDSDVISRLGGDEFAVLAIEASDFSENIIRARICKYLKSICAQGFRHSISLSVGAVRLSPGDTSSLEELMVQADQAMYEAKRGKRKTSDILESTYCTQ